MKTHKSEYICKDTCLVQDPKLSLSDVQDVPRRGSITLASIAETKRKLSLGKAKKNSLTENENDEAEAKGKSIKDIKGILVESNQTGFENVFLI